MAVSKAPPVSPTTMFSFSVRRVIFFLVVLFFVGETGFVGVLLMRGSVRMSAGDI